MFVGADLAARNETLLLVPPVRLAQLEEIGEEQPYHYGSHYSSAGAVLHFLIRLEPFTQVTGSRNRVGQGGLGLCF